MRVWVFARRGWARQADAFAVKLSEEGHSVGRATTRFYEGEVYSDAERIYHDGSSEPLVRVHENAGVECVFVDFQVRPSGKHEQAEEPEKERPAYRIEYAKPWHTIYDADDNKIGKATRKQDEAERRLAALIAGVPEEGDG